MDDYYSLRGLGVFCQQQPHLVAHLSHSGSVGFSTKDTGPVSIRVVGRQFYVPHR
jgi:hypothetical protein